MNKKIFLIIFSIAIVIIFVVYIVTSTNNYIKSNSKKIDEKTEEEIKQLEEKLVGMINSLNNISFTNTVLKQTSEKSSSTNSNNNSSNNSLDNSSKDSNNEQNSQSSESSNNDSDSISSKTEEQVKYEIQKNDILLIDLSNIDWEYIKANTESIYNLWANLIIDLHELNVNNQDILNFSNTLDQVTLSVKQENKYASITNLVSLYSYLPIYVNQFLDDENDKNIFLTKNCVLNTYALIEQQNWDEMKKQTASAIENFSNIMNNIENNERQNKNKITKIYVLLNELYSSIDLKDKELYYIKYRNVMEELINF